MNSFNKMYDLLGHMGVTVTVGKYECGKYIEISEDGFSVENAGDGESVRFNYDSNGAFISCILT